MANTELGSSQLFENSTFSSQLGNTGDRTMAFNLIRKAQLCPEIFLPAFQISIKHLAVFPPNTSLKRI